MPSFSSFSSIRVASQDHVLRLKVTHNLVHGPPTDTVRNIQGRLPKELDVLWLSDIFISLSGSLDGHQIPAHDIVHSGINADRVGLNNVSRPFLDDADGLSKLTLTPSRTLPDASRPYANLVSLHLAYIWSTIAGRSDIADPGHLVEGINPFSSTLFLPTEAILNRVTEQFFVYHLVSRYPLIFGSWSKRLDLEMEYFPSIGRSIVEIMTRSRDRRFLLRCKRLLKIARMQRKFVLQTATAALSSCTDDAVSDTSQEEVDELPTTPVLTDERVLCESLEQLFRMGVRQRRFKPTSRVKPQVVSLPQDDDNLLQCIPDVEVNGENTWVELLDTATSPSASSYRSFPEDVDVFAQDLPEDGMWRADAGLGERKSDTRSEEFRISGPISLASITTRSPQYSDPVALYHHQEDNRELGPAMSGLGYRLSQLARQEDAEAWALFANLPRSASHERHDPCCSENHEQVMGCRAGSERFELEHWSDRSEVADSDSLLFEVDVPDGADVTEFDELLV